MYVALTNQLISIHEHYIISFYTQKVAYCRNNCTNVDLDEFWRRCQMQIVYSKVHNLLESVDAHAFLRSSFVNNVIC